MGSTYVSATTHEDGSMNPLRFHARTRQWYFWDGEEKKRIYLGVDKMTAYERWQAIRDAKGLTPTVGPVLMVPALLEQYDAFLLRRDKKRHSSADTAIRFARELFADLPAAEFRLRCLRILRDTLIDAPPYRDKLSSKERLPRKVGRVQYARATINRFVGFVVGAFRWGAQEDLVPPDIWSTLLTLPKLHAGRGGRETPRVVPVEPWVVDATIPFCGPVLRDMIAVHRLAGMRPGELCGLRRRDISTTPGERIAVPNARDRVAARTTADGVLVWVAVPASHKTAYKGKVRVILLGPKCQEILRKYIERKNPDEFLFSPREDTRYTPREHARMNYTTNTYGIAIKLAVVRANKHRSANSLPELPLWCPNQLRHHVATAIAERYDKSAASATLGNTAGVIDVYVEQEIEKAARVAATMG